MEHGIATKSAWPHRIAAVAVGAATLGFPLHAGAQEQPSISLNRFHQTPAGDHFYGVPSPHVGEHLALELMASANYAHDPLVLLMETEDGDESVGSLVRHMAFLNLNGGMGLFDRLSVNLNIPVVMLQSGKVSPSDRMGYVSPDSAQLGDLRLGLRVRLFGEQTDALQVGVGGYLWFPTGAIDTPSFVSDGSVRGMPQLLAGGQIDRFLWTLATGPEVRESQDFGPTAQNSIWVWGAGVGMLLGEDQDWQVGAETTVSIDMTDPVTHNTNGEWLASGKWRFIENMENGIGFGTGYTQGMGTPDFRAIISLAYRSERTGGSQDRDGDGIDDDADGCPDAAGAPNPDPALHGCPDRDGDGIIDRLDACAGEPGVENEDPDLNGCPPDRDGDRIGDAVDACPDKPGEPNEDPLKHGCPVDRDGDGINDSDDACPDQPGEPSDDPATNGCPTDRDMDGVPDGQDACPDEAGEASDDPATNGCPPDRDGDGILNGVDACPDKKGIAQDDPAKNGCPLVEVTAGEVIINDKIQFELNKATLLPASNPLLDAIATVLKEHPELKKIEVQGHTDSSGAKWLNIRLSQQRADAVMKALVSREIEADRLTSKGYGPNKPIADNGTEVGQAKNRRVQFKIVERDAAAAPPPPKPAPPKPAPPKPAPNPYPAPTDIVPPKAAPPKPAPTPEPYE